jgi:hypothetical protein
LAAAALISCEPCGPAGGAGWQAAQAGRTARAGRTALAAQWSGSDSAVQWSRTAGASGAGGSSRFFFWSKMSEWYNDLRAKFYLDLIFFILHCLKVRIGFDGFLAKFDSKGKITNMDCISIFLLHI